MAHRQMQKLVFCPMTVIRRPSAAWCLKMLHDRHADECHQWISPTQWYERAFAKLNKLTPLLKNVDLIDGRVVNVVDSSTVFDDNIEHGVHAFKSLARAFLSCPSVQTSLKKNLKALFVSADHAPTNFFSEPSEREPLTLDSLTKVCNILNISTQQRNTIRLMVCPQVTAHRIWTGALVELLNDLKSDMESSSDRCSRNGHQMCQQIVSSCLKFLEETTISHDHDSNTWMRPAPARVAYSPPLGKWEDLLEMFRDLIRCLGKENKLCFYVSKLEVMKEGLLQIKDVLVDKNIGYREVKHQESLVQKKLTKTLGHSSRCLFTLLLYYICNSIRDIEVEVCGGLYEAGGDKYCLYLGRFLTSDEEKIVWSGVKQLDRALGLFKFVWELAGKKGVLELQGHLWCIGAESKSVTYRGNLFFIHGLSLCD